MENIEKVEQKQEVETLSRELISGKGTIIGINPRKGIGFIREEDGIDVFFQAHGVMGKFEDLKEGYRVKYVKIETPKGVKAIGISVI